MKMNKIGKDERSMLKSWTFLIIALNPIWKWKPHAIGYYPFWEVYQLAEYGWCRYSLSDTVSLMSHF
jgi:hypothetical protein